MWLACGVMVTHDARPDGERAPDVRDREVRAAIDRYWSANKRILLVLLVLWALVGPGCGILFAEQLNQIRVGGFRLGFWFAQQGSIAEFVVLILAYALLLNRLDKKHHQELEEIHTTHDASIRAERERIEGALHGTPKDDS